MTEMNSDIADNSGKLVVPESNLADLIGFFELSPAVFCLGLSPELEDLRDLQKWSECYMKDPTI